MTVTATFLNAQPGLKVSDLETAAAFYELFGFQRVLQNEDIHLVMRKDVVVIHLSTEEQSASCQIIVDEVEPLYEFAISQKMKILYDGLNHRPWGCRDFTICDPDGNQVTFSQQSSSA